MYVVHTRSSSSVNPFFVIVLFASTSCGNFSGSNGAIQAKNGALASVDVNSRDAAATSKNKADDSYDSTKHYIYLSLTMFHNPASWHATVHWNSWV